MTSPAFHQEWIGSWPSGSAKAVALLSVEPSTLAGRGIQFREGSDDLSSFLEAALRLRSGRALLLVRRPHPAPGIEVWADAEEDPSAALGDLLNALGLGEHQVLWLSQGT